MVVRLGRTPRTPRCGNVFSSLLLFGVGVRPGRVVVWKAVPCGVAYRVAIYFGVSVPDTVIVGGGESGGPGVIGQAVGALLGRFFTIVYVSGVPN